MKKLIGLLQFIEDTLLIGSLLGMLILAVMQIVLRNFLDLGIVWGDTLVRILLLWLGLIGAMAAGRGNRHITVDIVTRFLPARAKKIVGGVTALATGFVCGAAAWYAIQFVRLEIDGGEMAFSRVPVWLCGIIIPISFGVLALRYICLAGWEFSHRNEPPT